MDPSQGPSTSSSGSYVTPPMEFQENVNIAAAAAVGTGMTGGARPKTSTTGGQSSGDSAEVVLIGKHDKSVRIPIECAEHSPTLNGLVKNGTYQIECKQFSLEVLEKVKEYLKTKQDYKNGSVTGTDFEMEESMALEMLSAACYFDC
ncbi:UNVERIFIED_CONTAM: hypothetical protein RMT77_004004 [Armadillidium vulgare]